MIERNSIKLSNSGPLVYTVQDLLKTVYEMIQDKHLPNYFIPECNLISSYSGQQIEEVLSKMDNVSGQDIMFDDSGIDRNLIRKNRILSTIYSEQCKGFIGHFIRFFLGLYTR